MDDIQNPSIEGPESFVVFLSSPQGAVLQEPYEANVIITDTFQDSTYTTHQACDVDAVWNHPSHRRCLFSKFPACSLRRAPTR